LFVDGHADFYNPEANPNREAASMDLAFVTGRGPKVLPNIEGHADWCASSVKGGARSIPAIEYELLSKKPYFYTQEELQFAVYLEREGISSARAKTNRKQLWAQFFSKPRPCLRGSSLPKKYGWGLHFDKDGKIALVAVGSAAYKKFCNSNDLKRMPAFRSKRDSKSTRASTSQDKRRGGHGCFRLIPSCGRRFRARNPGMTRFRPASVCDRDAA
jgi:hypothetical protein